MRVLVLSAFVALAVAAPAPQFIGVVPAFVIAPTVPPGDVEAAVIDAQVKSLDQAQISVDQARELTEQAAENVQEGIIEANDLSKEKADLAVWAAEEKKWQDLNAEQLAIAQQQAAAANEGLSDESEVKAALPAEETKVEDAKTEEKVEQTAEIKSGEQTAEVKSENIVETSVEIKPTPEIAPEEKVDELKALKVGELKPKLLSPVVYAAPGLGFGYQPLITPVAYSQPAWNTYPAVTSIQNLQGQLLTQIH